MDAKLNRFSLMAGAPGILLQLAGAVLKDQPGRETLGLALLLSGSGLLIIGLALYAMAKGRSPAWGVMGLLSLIGLLVLSSLEDRRK